jgi:hypothetical protein
LIKMIFYMNILNVWIKFLNLFLQSFTGFGPENWSTSWGLNSNPYLHLYLSYKTDIIELSFQYYWQQYTSILIYHTKLIS